MRPLAVSRPSNASRASARGVALVAWVALRLPLAALLVVREREALSRWIEARLGLAWPTELAIVLVSTLRERAAVAAACLLVLGGGWGIAARGLRSRSAARALLGGLSLALLTALFAALGGGLGPADAAAALALSALLVANLPAPPRTAAAPSAAADWLFGAAVGSELALPAPCLRWAAARLGGGAARGLRRLADSGLPGPVLASLGAALFLHHSSWSFPHPAPPAELRALGEVLRADPAVERLAEGDFHSIALDASATTLFATGHGIRRLRAYDLTAPGAPFRAAAQPTGSAQDFAYDPEAGELYVYMPRARALAVLDARTLERRRRFAFRDVAPGDATVHWNPRTGEVFVLSEADREIGTAFLALDGATGRVIHRLPIAAGSGGLLDPERSRLYLIFFRRRSELLVYDTDRHELVREVATDPRVNGLALDAERGELLLGSPLHSAVLRYDADSLARTGEYATTFGVRFLAVDARRQLLLCASLATRALDVVDLASGRRTARFDVAPWLREIALDERSGLAYVSSKYGLFRVRYAAPSSRSPADRS